MYYQQNLRVQLQQRRNRLYKAVGEIYQNEARYFLDFINATPYFKSLTQELLLKYPDIEWRAWKAQHFDFQTFELPPNEIAAAKVCYGIICECTESKTAAWDLGLFIDSRSNIEQSIRAVTSVFVDPYIHYLNDMLDEGSNVLYLLEKYKRRVEWFHSQDLFDRTQADTSHSEEILDSDLREYLFDQGIDYPFSGPRSRSGKPDIVADTGEDKPLVLEIKIFDPGRGYDRAYIRQGFRQIHDYCGDYNQAAGYLVVFNCTDFNLVFTPAPQQGWPYRIHVSAKTIFIVVLDLKQPDRPASKRGPLKPYVIEESYLLDVLSPSQPTTTNGLL